jgi:peptidoglycan hydrolase-like protein with peptidoglycan-binding domain
MRLTDIVNGAPSVRLGDIGLHADLVRDVQERLNKIGLLDPPADGKFGPVSRWAFDAFLAKAKLKGKTEIDREVAQRLVGETADGLFPLNPKNDLAGRLVRAMQAKSHWIARHPDCGRNTVTVR